MTTQMLEPAHFAQKARQIKTRVSTVLTKWGLLPRFKRWRLTRDPETGMVVLFGVLNHVYIAAHTAIPFQTYFDPPVLHDLANELQVQVVSSNTDGLRYAFILDRARLGKVPAHIDVPSASVGYGEPPPAMPAPPVEVAGMGDHALVRQGREAFLKVSDDTKLGEDAALQTMPAIVVLDEDESNHRVAGHEARDRKTYQGSRPVK